MAQTVKVPGIGNVKKPYLYAGVGITAGILIWAWFRRAADKDEPAPAAAAEASMGDPYGLGSDAFGYNTVFPPAGHPFSQYGYDLYGNPLPPPVNPGSGGAYGSNALWSDAAIDYLERGGMTEQAAAVAISSVLGGLPVTSEQQAAFLRATGTLGEPPQGYPRPIRLKDSPRQPAPKPVVKVPGKPTGLQLVRRTQTTIEVKWNKVSGATGYGVFITDDPTGGGTPPEKLAGRYASTAAVLRGLTPGRRYRVDVHAFNSKGRSGPARIYAHTVTAPRGHLVPVKKR